MTSNFVYIYIYLIRPIIVIIATIAYNYFDINIFDISLHYFCNYYYYIKYVYNRISKDRIIILSNV